jgi:hypothetical protein
MLGGHVLLSVLDGDDERLQQAPSDTPVALSKLPTPARRGGQMLRGSNYQSLVIHRQEPINRA